NVRLCHRIEPSNVLLGLTSKPMPAPTPRTLRLKTLVSATPVEVVVVVALEISVSWNERFTRRPNDVPPKRLPHSMSNEWLSLKLMSCPPTPNPGCELVVAWPRLGVV